MNVTFDESFDVWIGLDGCKLLNMVIFGCMDELVIF